MRIDTELVARLERAIDECFKKETLENIQITSIGIDDDERRLLIVFSISTNAESKVLADRYYGLTEKVEDVLDDTWWSDYFPVLTPNFIESAHA